MGYRLLHTRNGVLKRHPELCFFWSLNTPRQALQPSKTHVTFYPHSTRQIDFFLRRTKEKHLFIIFEYTRWARNVSIS